MYALLKNSSSECQGMVGQMVFEYTKCQYTKEESKVKTGQYSFYLYL